MSSKTTALSETPGAEELRKELAASYRIRTITPTLEDVFIRSVEGEDR